MRNLMLLLGAACALSLSVSAANKAVVFVDKFEPNGGCRASASDIQILHDRIVGNVVSSRKYEVVERENLAKVQKELKLVDAGLTEGAAPESNRLKAAGYCVYGKLVQFRSFAQAADLGGGIAVKRVNGVVEIQIRITNVENGRILAAKTVKSEKSKAASNAVASTQNLEQEVMAEAVEDAAKLVVEKLNDIAFPVYVLSANSRFVTGNITEEQVTPGDVWEVFMLGDELKDPQTGEALGFDEELIAAVRVSRPGPKTTKFEYGADDATAEKAKKDVLAAKEDGEKMLLRRAVKELPQKPQKKPSMSALRGMR